MIYQRYIYDNSSEEYASSYKLCYTLGLFHTGNVMQAEVIDTITKMMDLYSIEEIKTMFTDIKIERYIDRFRKVIISEYNHPKLSEVITLFYNNFDDIVSHILKGRKEQIGILNAQNRNNSTPSLESQLKKLKEQKN